MTKNDSELVNIILIIAIIVTTNQIAFMKFDITATLTYYNSSKAAIIKRYDNSCGFINIFH